MVRIPLRHDGRLVPEQLLHLIEMALPGSAWVEIESSAVEVDGRLEVLGVAEAIGLLLIVWILVLSPSLIALVIRCSK